MLTSIVAFLFAVGLLVFVHELGHYLAARSVRIHVLRFSVGFGRPILKAVDRRGCEWVLAAVPLGGYVRMLDKTDPTQADIQAAEQLPVGAKTSFDEKSLAARAWVVAAGPFANFIFAAIAYAALGWTGRTEPLPVIGPPAGESIAAQAGLQSGDRIVSVNGSAIRSFTDLRWELAQSSIGEGQAALNLVVERQGALLAPVSLNLTPLSDSLGTDSPDQLLAVAGLSPQSLAVRVTGIQPAGAADRAGLVANEVIIAVNGDPVTTPQQLQALVQEYGGSPLTLDLVQLDASLPSGIQPGSQRQVTVQPELSDNSRYRLGVSIAPVIDQIIVRDGPLEALIRGIDRTIEVASLSLKAIYRMIQGDLSWRQISGPVGIADVAGQSAQLGIVSFISFLALVSISIGVLNLLPIPMLDGGHLLYYLFEFVRGQPLPLEAQQAGQRLGMVLIVLLTGLALVNDVSRVLGF